MWWLTIDLFASNHNHQLLVYCSRSKDPRVLAVDTRSIPWSGTSAYTFPPISLIQKVSREDCTLLLIAPFWPTSFGFIPPATGGSRATSSVPSTAGSIADAGVESSIQQRRALAFDGLDAVSQHFENEGLSKKSAELAARVRRPSSFKVYTARLRPYYDWCRRREVSPTSAPIAVIAISFELDSKRVWQRLQFADICHISDSSYPLALPQRETI